MFEKSQIGKLAERLRLSPYQAYVLENNCHKYDLSRLVKRGGILYAPYLSNGANRFRDVLSRICFGPRADLVGMERILVADQRGVKLYAMGFYSAHKRGMKYYADASGNRINRHIFFSIV